MYHLFRRRGVASLLLALAFPLVLSLFARQVFADNIGEGTTTTGQTLRILINEIVLGQDFVPGTPVTVTGQAVIGALNAPATLAYVIDVSSSTGSPANQDCNGDGSIDSNDNHNGDNSTGDILDCEISGVLALNNSLSLGTAISAGVTVFGSSAVVADVDPGPEENNIAAILADNDGNGINDLQEVVQSVVRGRVNLFTQKSVGTGTDFDDALTAVSQLFGTVSTEQKIAFFLSDGEDNVSTGDSSPLAAVRNSGITVNTYSVGDGSSGCGTDKSLQTIAETTGGTCTEVPDPTQLNALLPGTRPTGIDRVELTVNGSSPLSVTLDTLGNWSATIAACENGEDVIQATVIATDGTAVTADIRLCQEPTAIDPADEPTPPTTDVHTIFLPLIAAAE